MNKKVNTALLIDQFKKDLIKSCLEYEDFNFRNEEWDNVPEIIPRFLIYIE